MCPICMHGWVFLFIVVVELNLLFHNYFNNFLFLTSSNMLIC